MRRLHIATAAALTLTLAGCSSAEFDRPTRQSTVGDQEPADVTFPRDAEANGDDTHSTGNDEGADGSVVTAADADFVLTESAVIDEGSAPGTYLIDPDGQEATIEYSVEGNFELHFEGEWHDIAPPSDGEGWSASQFGASTDPVVVRFGPDPGPFAVSVNIPVGADADFHLDVAAGEPVVLDRSSEPGVYVIGAEGQQIAYEQAITSGTVHFAARGGGAWENESASGFAGGTQPGPVRVRIDESGEFELTFYDGS